VQNGDARSVPLVADRAIAALTPRIGPEGGRERAPALTLRYRGPLVAPVAKGTQVAELEVRTGFGPTRRLPLYAGATVAEAGPLDRLLNGLAGLFS
jgi:D-alanyl-D-alanine carboxypeptidase (penicillin-binding protein 5/6)